MSLFWFDDPASQTQWLMRAYNVTANKQRLASSVIALSDRVPQLAATISHYYPRLEPGVVAGMAMSQIDPTDPLAQQIALLDEEQRAAQADILRQNPVADIEPIWDGTSILDGLKGTGRLILGSFDALWEEIVTRPIRALVGQFQGLDYATAYERAGESYLMRAINEWQAGRPVNLGSGILPGSDLAPATQLMLEQGIPLHIASQNPQQQAMGAPVTQLARYQAETGITLTSRGGLTVPVSPGRLLAVTMMEPNTAMFNVVSGLTDLSANIFLDPANLIGAAYGKVKKASNVLVADNMVPGILQRRWTDYLDAADGRYVTNLFANMNADEDFPRIFGMLMKRQGVPNSELAYKLWKAQTPDAVRDILWDLGAHGQLEQTLLPTSLYQRGRLAMTGKYSPHLAPISQALEFPLALLPKRVAGGFEAYQSARQLTRLSGLGVGVKYGYMDTWLGRQMSEIGFKAIAIHDLDQGVHDLGEFLSSIGFSMDRIGYWMGRYAEKGPGNVEEAYNIMLRGILPEWGKKLAADGLPQPAVDSMLRMFTDSDTYRKYWLNALGQPNYHPAVRTKLVTERGDFINSPQAILMAEFLDQAIPVPDPREVRKAMQAASINRFRDAAGLSPSQRIKDWADFGPSVMTQTFDGFINKIWKPMVLLRPAWSVRVLGEESLRMWAAGLSGGIHPIHNIMLVMHKKFQHNVLGDDFLDLLDHEAAMSRSGVSRFMDDMGGLKPPHLRDYDAIAPNDPRYHLARALEAIKLRNDAVTQRVIAEMMEEAAGMGGRVADVPGLVEAKKWFSTGDGREYLRRLLADGGSWNRLSLKSMQDRYLETLWARTQAFAGAKLIYQDHRTMLWYYQDGRPVPLDRLPSDIQTRIGYRTATGHTAPVAPGTPAAIYSRLLQVEDALHMSNTHDSPAAQEAVRGLLEELGIDADAYADWTRTNRAMDVVGDPQMGGAGHAERELIDIATEGMADAWFPPDINPNVGIGRRISELNDQMIEAASRAHLRGAGQVDDSMGAFTRPDAELHNLTMLVRRLARYATGDKEFFDNAYHLRRDLRMLLDDTLDDLSWSAVYRSRDITIPDELYQMMRHPEEMDALLGDHTRSIASMEGRPIGDSGIPDDDVTVLVGPYETIRGSQKAAIELSTGLRDTLDRFDALVGTPARPAQTPYSLLERLYLSADQGSVILHPNLLMELRYQTFDSWEDALNQLDDLRRLGDSQLLYDRLAGGLRPMTEVLAPDLTPRRIKEARDNLDEARELVERWIRESPDEMASGGDIVITRSDVRELMDILQANDGLFDNVTRIRSAARSMEPRFTDPGLTGWESWDAISRDVGRALVGPGPTVLPYGADPVLVATRDGNIVGTLQIGARHSLDLPPHTTAHQAGLEFNRALVIRSLRVAPGHEDDAVRLIRKALDEGLITPEGLYRSMVETDGGLVSAMDWLAGHIIGKLRRWPDNMPSIWLDEGAAEAMKIMRALGLDGAEEWQPLYRALSRGGLGRTPQAAWADGPTLYHKQPSGVELLLAPGPIERATRTGGGSVHGPIFYSTPSEHVAEVLPNGYSGRGDRLTYLEWLGSKPPRLLAYDQTLDPKVPELRALGDELRQFIDDLLIDVANRPDGEEVLARLMADDDLIELQAMLQHWEEPDAILWYVDDALSSMDEIIQLSQGQLHDLVGGSFVDWAETWRRNLIQRLRDNLRYDGMTAPMDDSHVGWMEYGFFRPEMLRLRSVADDWMLGTTSIPDKPFKTLDDLRQLFQDTASKRPDELPLGGDLEWLMDQFRDAVSTKVGRDLSRAEALLPTWSPNARNPSGQVDAILRALDPKDLAKEPLYNYTWRVIEPADPEVLDALAKGEIAGWDLSKMKPKAGEAHPISTRRRGLGEIAEWLEQQSNASGILGENWMPIPRAIDEYQRKGLDDVIRFLFDTLMTKPTNFLSRSPAFRQFYWKRMGALMPFMDGPTRERALLQARDAGVERASMRTWIRELFSRGDDIDKSVINIDELVDDMNLKNLRSLPDPMRAMSLDEADAIAKAFALEETKRLLYDTSRRHTFWDKTRLIFPFGEAWWEIMSTWNRLLMDNPRLIRRAQQFVNGARTSDPISAIVNPQYQDDRGFFYKDPVSGEEIFNYPGWDLIAGWMFGSETQGSEYMRTMQTTGGLIPGDEPPLQYPLNQLPPGASIRPQITGRVSGVNLLLGSFMPGVGPLVQIPAALMPALNEPRYKILRELILPFGGEASTSIGEIADNFVMPSWARKALVAFGQASGDSVRLYGNTVIDVLRHRIQTGQSNWNSYEDMQEAMRNAENEAKFLWLIRFGSQFIGPTGGTVRFDVRDSEGNLWAFQTLSTEYRKMLEDNNWNHDLAFSQFVARFGLDPSLYYTAKTRAVVRRSVTEPGADWQVRNRDLFDRYTLTAYFANPDTIRDPFYYPAYLEQLRDKVGGPDRISLSPQQWWEERNDFLGRIAYERMRMAYIDPRTGRTRTDPVATLVLRNYRLQLATEYPGFDSITPGLAEPIPTEQLISELYDWEREPRLAETQAGRAVMTYLSYRDWAIAQASAQGITERGFGTAQRTEYLRFMLSNIGRQLVEQYPQFGPVWEQVLSRELQTDQMVDIMGIQVNTGGS